MGVRQWPVALRIRRALGLLLISVLCWAAMQGLLVGHDFASTLAGQLLELFMSLVLVVSFLGGLALLLAGLFGRGPAGPGQSTAPPPARHGE